MLVHSSKYGREKNAETYKAYITLFVASTIWNSLQLILQKDLELHLKDLPLDVVSISSNDWGINFKSADAELQRLFTLSTQELDKLLATLLANDGTQWRFNHHSLHILLENGKRELNP